MNIPLIFHTSSFTTAPQCHATYIRSAHHSQERYFPSSDWNRKNWNENDFLALQATSEWRIPRGETLIDRGAWAIISDFLRLYALYTYGGLYADWDVEFIRDIRRSPLWKIQKSGAIIGFEPYTHNGRHNAQIGMHVAMSSASFPLWKEVYADYARLLWSDEFDILPGVMTRRLQNSYMLPMKRDDKRYTYLDDGITICPIDVFSPFRGWCHYDEKKISKNTLCIHWEHSQQKDLTAPGWPRYLSSLKTFQKNNVLDKVRAR